METPDRIVEENATSQDYLQPTATINADHPEVIAFARRVIGGATDPLAQATRLYLAVRDDFQHPALPKVEDDAARVRRPDGFNHAGL